MSQTDVNLTTGHSVRFRGSGSREVIRLAIPSIVNMASLSLMQFVDGWMVSVLGKEALAAQFGGAMVSFTILCFFMGTVACVNSFVAQHFGAKQYDKCGLFGWQAIWFALLAGGAVCLFIPFAPVFYNLLGHEPKVIEMEIGYFAVILSGGFLLLIARGLSNFFIGIQSPSIALAAAVAANITNVIANYILIYGKFGVPAYGVTGAAMGTFLGNLVEAIFLFWIFCSRRNARRFSIWSNCRFDPAAMKALFLIGSPAGFNWLSDVLMWTVFLGGIIATFGTDYLAAAAILNRYWHLCFMPAVGVSIALTALVGKYIGEESPASARARAYAGLYMVIVYMVTSGFGVWYFREGLVSFFNSNNDPAVQSIAASLFIVIAICQFFDGLSIVFIGALRGAGDTFWPSTIQVLLAWTVGIGGAFFFVHFYPSRGIYGPWAAATAYICLLGVMMWLRFELGSWEKMRLIEITTPSLSLAKPESKEMYS